MMSYSFKNSDEIGSLDAESDSFLEDCFLEANVYKTLQKFNRHSDFNKRIIVGRTGSGKTAILKKLATDSTIKKQAAIEAESTVFEHISNNVFISKLMNNDIDLRIFYKSLWIHVLIVKVVDLTFTSNKSFFERMQTLVASKKKKYNLKLAQEYISKYSGNFFNDKIVSEITEKMQHELNASLKMGPTDVTGKLVDNVIKKIQLETARYVSSELLKKQKELIKVITEETADERQSRIIISIDDLDKSWLSSSTIRYDFISALLDAFKELLGIRTVKILLSIRSDILMGVYKRSLRQEEKDRSLIVPIEWNRKEIMQILDKRISYLIKHKYAEKTNVNFSDIFDFQVKGQAASAYIIDRTMLRPRDAIDFVNYCLKEGDGETIMHEGYVLAAEEKYYTSRKNAINKEWKSIYKHIADYTNSIALLDKQEFLKSEVSSNIAKIEEYLVNRSKYGDDQSDDNIATDFSSLLNVWFTIGIIGIKKTDNLIIFSSFDKPRLDISDFNKKFFVHPLFFRI